MRKGKMIAQGAHASLGAVFLIQDSDEDQYDISVRAAAFDWINGMFAKICVSVNSEQELLQVYTAAEAAGLPVKLITDSGLTEFHGVPTKTCLAIGPAWADDIDKITGNLPLL